MFPQPKTKVSLPTTTSYHPTETEYHGFPGSFVLSESKVTKLNLPQRLRFVQPTLLHNQELLVRRETFGEKASSLFGKDMYDEILVKNVELDEAPTGELFPVFIEGYSADDLLTDTKALLQDVMSLTQNIPSVQTCLSILEDVPAPARERLQKLFTDVRAEYEASSQHQIKLVKEEERWADKASRHEEL